VALELAPGWTGACPLQHPHQSLYQVLVKQGKPLPCPMGGSLPGSESVHPLPLGGLGVVWVGRAWPGWNVWSWWVGEGGQVPLPAPTGGL
jgi:hypothetical protein